MPVSEHNSNSIPQKDDSYVYEQTQTPSSIFENVNMGNSQQCENEENNSNYYSNVSGDEEDEDFVEMIKKWAVTFNISQSALKELIAIYNY